MDGTSKQLLGYDSDLPDWIRNCEAHIWGPEESVRDNIRSEIKILARCRLKLTEWTRVRYISVGVLSETVWTSLMSHFLSAGRTSLKR